MYIYIWGDGGPGKKEVLAAFPATLPGGDLLRSGEIFQDLEAGERRDLSRSWAEMATDVSKC